MLNYVVMDYFYSFRCLSIKPIKRSHDKSLEHRPLTSWYRIPVDIDRFLINLIWSIVGYHCYKDEFPLKNEGGTSRSSWRETLPVPDDGVTEQHATG